MLLSKRALKTSSSELDSFAISNGSTCSESPVLASFGPGNCQKAGILGKNNSKNIAKGKAINNSLALCLEANFKL